MRKGRGKVKRLPARLPPVQIVITRWADGNYHVAVMTVETTIRSYDEPEFATTRIVKKEMKKLRSPNDQ